MAQRESRRSREIIKALKAEGIWSFKVHGGAMMMSGLPDIVACVDGLFVGLETKLETKQTEIQKFRQEEIQQAGGFYFIVHTKREALDAVAWVRAHRKVKKVR